MRKSKLKVIGGNWRGPALLGSILPLGMEMITEDV